MSRTVRHTNLETRAARLRLRARRKPYWRVLETGLHLGYRRTKEGGGSWVARRSVGSGRYVETKMGTADDLQDADGIALRSFQHAQEAAREWWRIERRHALGHAPAHRLHTVAQALDAYFADRERRGSKGLPKDRAAAHLRIVPPLGDVELGKLSAKRIRDWHTSLAIAPKLTRSLRRPGNQNPAASGVQQSDAVRARRATANRTLTILKAALNHAFHEGHVASDEAWRKVKPFRETDAAIVHFLSETECRRLVDACDEAFRDIVRGALLTGCRYGELVRMRVRDFNAQAGTIAVQVSKAGKARHVVLTKEGQALFTQLAAGRTGTDPIFLREDGKTWGPSHQQRPLSKASRRAKIVPAPTFHILRHTYASALAARGVPLGVIAAQLGHADTRMTERHYAHLSPNYIAAAVRAALPVLGIVQKSNVPDHPIFEHV